MHENMIIYYTDISFQPLALEAIITKLSSTRDRNAVYIQKH